MAPLSVAVTGIAGFLGQRLLVRLDAEPSVGRIVGLDVREPLRRAPALESHRVDVARQDLVPLLEDVDVVVHLAAVVDPVADDALMARVNVDGTRRVLEAAAATGVRKVVRVSTSAAYGAWATNPVPLTEDAPLRPNPGFGPATQAAEVERLIHQWHQDHPDTVVTTLRAAPVLGPGAAHLWVRLLTGAGRLRVRGDGSPPVQVLHVDDAVAALALVVRDDHPGVFNVSSDGWLTAEAAAALLPRPKLPPLPADVLRRALARTWSSGVGDIPPGVLPYLVHPWVVASDRLEALGWAPMHTNEETLLETVDAAPAPTFPTARVMAAGATIALAGAAGAHLVRRQVRRRSRRVSAKG